MVMEIMGLYGAQIVGTLLVTLFGVFGMLIRQMVAKYMDTDTKRAMAKIVVQFAEQVYRDLHGEEKLNAALAVFSQMLAEKHIKASQMEMKVLLEAAVAEFNEAFKK